MKNLALIITLSIALMSMAQETTLVLPKPNQHQIGVHMNDLFKRSFFYSPYLDPFYYYQEHKIYYSLSYKYTHSSKFGIRLESSINTKKEERENSTNSSFGYYLKPSLEYTIDLGKIQLSPGLVYQYLNILEKSASEREYNNLMYSYKNEQKKIENAFGALLNINFLLNRKFSISTQLNLMIHNAEYSNYNWSDTPNSGIVESTTIFTESKTEFSPSGRLGFNVHF